MRRWPLLALLVGGCSFGVDGFDVGHATPDGAVPDLSVASMQDLAGGGGSDLASAVDLASSRDLLPDPCAPAPAPPPPGSALAHCALGETTVVDGKLTDWDQATFFPISHSTPMTFNGGTWGTDEAVNDATLSGSVAARWDAQNLYIAALITDDVRGLANTTNYYQDDAIEIYLDGNDDGGDYAGDDYQLIFTAAGAGQLYKGGALQAQLPMGVVAATSDTGVAAGWSIEVAIPWARLSGSASLGRLVGFDIQLDDNDGGNMQQRNLVWRNDAPGGCQCMNGGACWPYCSATSFAPLQLAGR